MEGLTDRRNVFGTELSCRIEMSSKNRGTRIGSLRYRSRESRKLIAPLLFNLLILDEMFLYIYFLVILIVSFIGIISSEDVDFRVLIHSVLTGISKCAF